MRKVTHPASRSRKPENISQRLVVRNRERLEPFDCRSLLIVSHVVTRERSKECAF